MSGEFYGPLASLYDEVVVDPCFPAWAKFLNDHWSTDPDGVDRVLDVGCGTGLLAAELLTFGFDVVGIDGSTPMLERARARLGNDVTLVQSVLPSVPNLGLFDAAVSTFDTLNYLTPDAFAATVTTVAERLRVGGWWVFDLHTDALLDLIEQQPHSAGDQAGWSFTLDSAVDPTARTCQTRFSATEASSGRAVDEEHVQCFFTDDQVVTALNDAGFDVTAVVDEYTDAVRTDETLRATWITRRR